MRERAPDHVRQQSADKTLYSRSKVFKTSQTDWWNLSFECYILVSEGFSKCSTRRDYAVYILCVQEEWQNSPEDVTRE